jgi:hypothetical protein
VTGSDDSPEAVVRRYYEVVADLASTEDDLRSVRTVRDGLVAEHQTYDCYEPFGS